MTTFQSPLRFVSIGRRPLAPALAIFFGAFVFACALAPRADAKDTLVYVGGYTDWELFGPPRRNPPGERGQGLYAFRFDLDSGRLTPLGLAAATDNPTYTAFSPDGRVLYAVNEIYRFHAADSGAVSAFVVDAANGRLTLLNQLASRGTGPCYATVDRAGRNLLVANFGSGSVAVFPLATDGALRAMSAFEQDTGSGPSPRQAGPHAHAINLSPDNRFAVASEFGTDRLRVYRFDAATGALQPADPPSVALEPASAPRHLAFHPNGRVAYSLNEIANTLTLLDYDAARGSFRVRQSVSTLPAGFTDRNTAAEVIVHPSGKFLYASNRGDHSIAVFALAADGAPKLVAHVPCGGRTPRGFALDPTGRWMIVAHQDSHTIAVFAINPATGVPSPNGQTAPVRTPTGVKFRPLVD
ncbi:MAG TPA: lactonase family protein [Opitutaceae bacterium]|nr:lactonase family protein [Opitutaceae bacterium]